MDRLLNMLGGGGAGQGAPNPDAPVNDTAETVLYLIHTLFLFLFLFLFIYLTF